MIIGINLISTGKYHIFVQPLIDSIETYFLNDHKLIIYLFSDKIPEYSTSDRIKIIHIPTEHKPFPFPTLFRYKLFSDNASIYSTDFLFYLDVDMKIVEVIGEEILPNNMEENGITAILHPGFYQSGGAWGSNPLSTSYTAPEHRKRYFCGGFQGGETQTYLRAAKEMAENIDADYKKGIIAQWHDETHWNKFLSNKTKKVLSPSYCYPEATWAEGMPFVKKILALEKNHSEIRS